MGGAPRERQLTAGAIEIEQSTGFSLVGGRLATGSSTGDLINTA